MTVIRRIINPLYVDLVKQHANIDFRLRKRLLNCFKTEKIIDVGGHLGQYTQLSFNLYSLENGLLRSKYGQAITSRWYFFNEANK